MFQILEQDYQRYRRGQASWWRFLYLAAANAGFRAVLLYRAGAWLYRRRMRFAAGMCQRLMHHWCHCWISVSAEIGPGFLIAHVGSLVIGDKTRIGANCDVRQNVTFGGNYEKKGEAGRSQPWVGDNVSVGVGAVIIGPIHIGSNSIIGANSVVNRDVPENVIVFGVPAKIVRERWDAETGRKP